MWLHTHAFSQHLKLHRRCCLDQPWNGSNTALGEASVTMDLQDFGSTAPPLAAKILQQLNMMMEICMCIIFFLLLMVVMVLRALTQVIDHINRQPSSQSWYVGCTSNMQATQGRQLNEILQMLQNLKDLMVSMKVQLDIIIEPRIALAETMLSPRQGSSTDQVQPV